MLIIALLISLFLLLGTSLMGQNPPIALPADGDWPTVVGDSIMLIGPKQEALTEEQRYFNPPYLLVYPGKEHLKNDMIRAAICDCNPANPNRRIGVFSVAPDKQVSFSQGNLQYLPAANIWKFANTQYEYLGNANKYLKPTFRNWVDLFGWSANNTTAPFGVSTSTNVADYAGAFVDWGENEICGDAPNTWRTLSADEWEFLFEKRSNALQLRSKGSIEGHRGYILLPDNWVLPDGVQFVAEPNNLTMDLDINSYTQAEWRIMEKAGAIFLPAAGRRDGTTVGYLVEYSGVWSSTSTTNTNAYHSYYNYESEIIEHHWTSATSRMNGRSVRLVHDTVVPTPEPEYVDLGLSVKWATFNVGATSPEDYGDYFAWGETEPKETYSWATYKWGTSSSNLTKYNATDGKTILEPADDATHVHWGDKWRMPSKEEVDELTQQCTWIWTTHNNVNGYKVTGPNGNSIFLPAVGYKGSGPSYPAGEDGLYWTKNIEKGHFAYGLCIHNDAPPKQASTKCTRYLGFAVRAVYDDRPPKRIGVFSVAEDKQVSFSQGNLQYAQSTDEWRFAREQYEYIGAANIKDGALADKIDLFGWSANNTTTPFGVSMSTNNADYAGDFVDWGTNTISGDAPNTWRTLSNEEWEYLINTRPHAANLQGIAQVNGVNGLILLPDDWVCPKGVSFVHGFHSNFGEAYFAQYQQFTLDQWIILEQSGAVFLPASKWRNGNTFTNSSEGGHYWSSTCGEISTNAHYFSFGSQEAWINCNSLHHCFSVRLVHDTIVPTPIPEPCLVVKVNDTLSINMMCVEGGTFTMGASLEDPETLADELPQHEVTLSNYYIGKYEVTQRLWRTIMGSNPSKFIGDDLPVESVTWDECYEFLDKLNAITGLNFRLPTEAEWEYAARGGNKSKGYTYAGSNNINEVAWYQENCNQTQPVGRKRPNELGIYDMTGNVYEKCSNWYAPYPSEPQVNPQGANTPIIKNCRIVRGGCWYDQGQYTWQHCCRVVDRGYQGISDRSSYKGLRLVLEPEKHYRYGYTQANWDAATASWGHQGRGHAPADQSCIQGTMVHGVRLKIARAGSLNVYKVPSLLEKNEDHFELVATLTRDSTGLQEFDFAEPIYIAPNEYLVFGKPSEEEPTLRPCWLSGNANGLPEKAKGVAHYIGTEKAEVAAPNGSLMVEFY